MTDLIECCPRIARPISQTLNAEEIKRHTMLFEGKKHYFIINFPQRAGALRDFLKLLGPNNDISRFEYTQKTNRNSGPALVVLEFKRKEDFVPLVARMKEADIYFQHLNKSPLLFEM